MGLVNTIGYGLLYGNIASNYEKQGKKVLAGKYYRKAYDVLKKIGYEGQEKKNYLKNAERLGN